MKNESESRVATIVLAIAAILVFFGFVIYVGNQSDKGWSLYEDSKLIRDGPK